jgi:DoxX-like family
MSALTSHRTYVALAAFQAGDAVACAVQIPPIKKVLDDLGVAEELRPVLPIAKAASAIGLLSVSRFPGLARLTTFMLTVYFVLAVAGHVRVRDRPVNAVPAVGFLALYAAMTIIGPPRR